MVIQQATTIILCAGPLNHTNLPMGTNLSNAMIPVNGKPVIAWILDDLLAKGIAHATLVLRGDDQRLQRFLKWAYDGRMELLMVPVTGGGSIIESLQAGLDASSATGPVRLVLGDTLIRDAYEGEDFVYVGRVSESRRWCLAVTNEDGYICDYLDKQEGVSEPHMALAGYYHLTDGAYLRHCVAESLVAGECELSHVLRRYGQQRPLQARPVQEWYDFGHIDNLVHARRQLLQPRYFNTLTINPILNTITKVSENSEKLRDELEWYLQIPEELKVLTPRIISHRQTNGRLEIVQEYYGYPSLAELYVYGDLHPDTWASILRHVMCIHGIFRGHPGRLSDEALAAIYTHKTMERFHLLRHQDAFWAETLAQETVVYNGRSLLNILPLQERLHERTCRLVETATVCVIHGDFCFSNILFDINHQIIRLIDPRGSFGARGIYGDSRYDIAKLRHSISGCYDFIVAGLFHLQGDPAGGFQGHVYANGVAHSVAHTFDKMIVEAGYDLQDIRLIEALLFISMLPLHSDHPQRQRMLYLAGLQLLNDAL